MLRPVPWRMNAAQDDLSDGDLVSVLHRIVRVPGLGRGVDTHGNALLQREPPMAGEVIRMRVRLDRPHDVHASPLRLVEVLLDREGWVDDDSGCAVRVADQVRGATERVVDELREDHDLRRYQRRPLFLLK